ncbi:MAG TPA: aromatic ring-hydroxylating dioxygenase subunit alpha [Nocardioidaceae bacterium]|nr:aromatic ring-hydroxylating dioxygenase subunit alpha [Nocardioidaceae bacterium]
MSAAPLDADQLALSLAAFGTSRMLPKAAYLDPAVLEWERQHVFGGWVCLGRTEGIEQPRSLKAFDLGNTTVLVSRDEAGELHAFENACRHRGHELLPCGASAQPRAVVCPYHGWAYHLDGRLLGAPGFKNVPGFDPAAHGLMGMPVRDWHGWLFVDPSRDAVDLADHLADLEPVVAPYSAETLRTRQSHTYDVAANWKVVVENYQECYHCSNIHPELCRVSPPDSGENVETGGTWVGGWMELRDGAETMSLDGRSSGAQIATLTEKERRTVMYAAVLPNLLISLHPDYVMTHQLVPVAVDRTRITCSWAFPLDQPDGFDPSYAVDFWDLTNRQDWGACESVQRGLAAPHFRPGPLAPEEDGVYHFVRLMARTYLGTADEPAVSG